MCVCVRVYLPLFCHIYFQMIGRVGINRSVTHGNALIMRPEIPGVAINSIPSGND